MLELEYELNEAGWARARVRDDDVAIEMAVSYLHDSLKDLAEAALSLANGGKTGRAVFMDEPGEHQIWLERIDDENLKYTVVWYADWESWGMHPSDTYRLLCEGSCTVSHFRQQVADLLWKIYMDVGEEKYEELWGAHKFPSELFEELMDA